MNVNGPVVPFRFAVRYRLPVALTQSRIIASKAQLSIMLYHAVNPELGEGLEVHASVNDVDKRLI